jgi:hypothetical protein
MLLRYDEGIEEILERQDEIRRQILISEPRSKKKQTFYGQEYATTCGQACIRTILYNLYNIKFKDEETLIELEESLYRKIQKEQGKKLSKYYSIKENGTAPTHFKNLANFFGLRTFSSNYGTIDNMKYLLENDIWPIIVRPFDKSNPGNIDDTSHYLVLYRNLPNSNSFRVSNPYNTKKHNKEDKDQNKKKYNNNIGKKGIEMYNKFEYNWTYKNDPSRGYLFFCKPDMDLKKLKGSFL